MILPVIPKRPESMNPGAGIPNASHGADQGSIDSSLIHGECEFSK
jgi:hypothetical protein